MRLSNLESKKIIIISNGIHLYITFKKFTSIFTFLKRSPANPFVFKGALVTGAGTRVYCCHEKRIYENEAFNSQHVDI